MTKLPCIILVFLTAGCAIAPESLPRSTRKDQLVLPEGLKLIAYFANGRFKREEGVFPGVYKPEREDDEGVYYFGPAKSYWRPWPIGTKDGSVGRYAGGVLIPHADGKPPRFFYIFERNPETVRNIDSYTQQRVISSITAPAPGVGAGPAVVGNVMGGVLVQALIEAEVGKIVKSGPIEDPDLVKKIQMARIAEITGDKLQRVDVLREAETNNSREDMHEKSSAATMDETCLPPSLQHGSAGDIADTAQGPCIESPSPN